LRANEEAGLRRLDSLSFKIGKLEAVGRRLKRNYIFIFVLITLPGAEDFIHATEPID
jgi:uncharacterized membrane protein